MKRIKESVYSLFGDFDFIEITKKFEFDFMIEAGTHDGSDSEVFLRTFEGKILYGFEPDPVAFNSSSNRLKKFVNAKLANVALSNHSGTVALVKSGEFGSGSTSVTAGESSTTSQSDNLYIKCEPMDEAISINGRGMLWLDVVGHAVQVLQGATQTLNSIIAAKIEVQMHDMYGLRKRDAWSVISLLKSHNLIPLRFPIYPGFFGDILFVRNSECTFLEKLQSRIYSLVFSFLHRLVYRILQKPVNKWDSDLGLPVVKKLHR